MFAAPRVERRRCAAPILVRSGVCWRVRCLTRREPSGHCVRGVWCVLLRGVLSCVRCSEPVGTSFVTPWPDAVDRSASNSSSSRCAPGSPSKRGNGPPVEPPPHAHAPMMVSALASGAKHMLNLHPCTATLHGQAALTRLRSALKQWLRAPHTLCVAWCAHVCVCVCVFFLFCVVNMCHDPAWACARGVMRFQTTCAFFVCGDAGALMRLWVSIPTVVAVAGAVSWSCRSDVLEWARQHTECTCYTPSLLVELLRQWKVKRWDTLHPVSSADGASSSAAASSSSLPPKHPAPPSTPAPSAPSAPSINDSASMPAPASPLLLPCEHMLGVDGVAYPFRVRKGRASAASSSLSSSSSSSPAAAIKFAGVSQYAKTGKWRASMSIGYVLHAVRPTYMRV